MTMNPLFLVAVMVMAVVPAADAMLTIDGNSISGDYCTVSCDAEGFMIIGGSLAFEDSGVCHMSYADTSGKRADIHFLIVSEEDLDGCEVEIVLDDGVTVRRNTAVFDSDECDVLFPDVDCGRTFTLSGYCDGDDSELSLRITAIPKDSGRHGVWQS